MKKNYHYLLLFFVVIASCDNKEDLSGKNQSANYPQQLYIINGDIEYYADITDGSKPKKPIFIYDIPEKIKENTIQKTTSKTSEQTTVLDFNYGIYDHTNSGCTIKRYNGDKEYYTDAGVYGYNPYPQVNGYLVRGYGTPNQNLYYGALVLHTTNKGIQTVDSRSKTVINDNLSTIAAISIEFPFKANVTYEISLKTFFIDNRKMVENIQSSGYPTLNATLENSGILFGGNTSCENNYRPSGTLRNYIKSYTLEDNIIKDRVVTYKFSPTEAKSALIFTLLPERGQRGVDAKIPTSRYTMVLRSVTITEKPFDPSQNEVGGRR